MTSCKIAYRVATFGGSTESCDLIGFAKTSNHQEDVIDKKLTQRSFQNDIMPNQREEPRSLVAESDVTGKHGLAMELLRLAIAYQRLRFDLIAWAKQCLCPKKKVPGGADEADDAEACDFFGRPTIILPPWSRSRWRSMWSFSLSYCSKE